MKTTNQKKNDAAKKENQLRRRGTNSEFSREQKTMSFKPISARGGAVKPTSAEVAQHYHLEMPVGIFGGSMWSDGYSTHLSGEFERAVLAPLAAATRPGKTESRKHMKNNNPIIGQVKYLRNILGISMTAVLALVAANPAHAISITKVTTTGNDLFGAKATYKFSEGVLGTTYSNKFSAKAEGIILKQTVQLASGEANLFVGRDSKCRAFGNLKLGTATVTSWNVPFTGSTTFSTPPFFNQSISVSAPCPGFPLITLHASAGVKIRAEGSASIASTTQGFKVHASLGPVADASASVAASAIVGVEGVLSLTGAKLIGAVDYSHNVIGFFDTAKFSVTASTGTPGGAINLTLDLGPIPFIGGTHRLELCSFQGSTSSVVLASGSVNIPTRTLNIQPIQTLTTSIAH